MSLLSVNDAQTRILTMFEAVEATTLPLDQASGRVLAADIRATTSLPPFDNSSMDGFAVRAADLRETQANAPRILEVVADIPAGAEIASIQIKAGQAARIMTGAPLPQGTDTVVPVEQTDFTERSPGVPAPAQVAIYQALAAGSYVRSRGEDLSQDQVVLKKGQRLRPQDLGLLAMLGIATVPVFRQPRAALLSSGDELIPVEAALEAGKVRDANSYTLAALIEAAGAEVLHLGIAADRQDEVQARLEHAVAEGVDLIISSAGVSVGAFDFVKDVVESQGELTFWRVNMRPGKPLAFGSYHNIPFFGLPGNPVSAFVSFEVFVRPALEKFSGQAFHPRQRIRVQLTEPVESDGRESYLRAVVSEENGSLTARLTGHQGSGNLLSLVQANALLIVPAGVKSLATGAVIDAWMLTQ
jgi:molybdopterin molybdotransferase